MIEESPDGNVDDRRDLNKEALDQAFRAIEANTWGEPDLPVKKKPKKKPPN